MLSSTFTWEGVDFYMGDWEDDFCGIYEMPPDAIPVNALNVRAYVEDRAGIFTRRRNIFYVYTEIPARERSPGLLNTVLYLRLQPRDK